MRGTIVTRVSILSALLLSGSSLAAEAEHLSAVVLWYQEQESGIEPYLTRVVITDRYVRLDEGDAAGDFLLYDVEERTLHNVVHGNATVMTLAPGEQPVPDVGMVTEQRLLALEDAPLVEGLEPRKWLLNVGSRVCYQAVVVPGALPEVASRLGALQETLAWQSRAGLDRRPEEMRTPCFLARYILSPDAHWRQGLVIQEWDGEGYRRDLVNYEKNVEVAESLFDLPATYQDFTPPP